MPSYIIPGEKVQFFEPPHEPHGGIESHGGGESHGDHDEHEEQLQEYVDPSDSHGIPSGRVHFDDVVHVQEHPSSVPQPELIPKKKNNDWIFFIILLLIAVGASIFFKG
jgi:hypothetical protein